MRKKLVHNEKDLGTQGRFPLDGAPCPKPAGGNGAQGNSPTALLGLLKKAVLRATAQHVRTTPLCSYDVSEYALFRDTQTLQISLRRRPHPAERTYSVTLDIRDLLLIGAITESDILLTGKTGSGKTSLATAFMNALFGQDGCYVKTALPTMSPSEFMDMDFPAILEGRKTLREAISGVSTLARPGMVLNEINRAPASVQSLLIALLDNLFEIQGVPVTLGRSWSGGHYQFRILTINEGEIYQVQELDPAIRDRMTIEIPTDAFPQTRSDILTMLDGPGSSTVMDNFPSQEGLHPQPEDHFNDVLLLRNVVDRIPVPVEVRQFLCYLAGLSYCVRAPRGNKESIQLSPEVCDGCHHLGTFHGLCGNVMAPSGRILLRLQKVARAFALFRAWSTGRERNLVVLPEDVIEAAPFVFYSKLQLNPFWVKTAGDRMRPFRGDRWTAIREILAWLHEERFLPLLSPGGEMRGLLHRATTGTGLDETEWEKVYQYVCEKDPCAFDPAVARKASGCR